MVLPSTGNTISFNDIRIELGVGSASPFDIAGAAAGTFSQIQNCQAPWPDSGSTQGANPDAINEWWSYDHSKTGSLWAQGNVGSSCFNLCNGSAGCNQVIYQFGSKYYQGSDRCIASSIMNTSFVAPTTCIGGTNIGQTCYTFVNSEITSTETCTACLPNGDPCPPDPTDCCSGGCCNGFCDANPC